MFNSQQSLLRPISRMVLMIVLVFLMATTPVPSLKAGSIIEHQLASLREVKVEVLVGALQYEPPQGLDLGDLQRNALKVSIDALQSHGIRVNDSAKEHVIIAIRELRNLSTDTYSAMIVDVQLREPAALLRESSSCQEPPIRRITSWSDTSIITAQAGVEEEGLREAIATSVLELAQKALQARSRGESE
ncbi:MAG: hypothetical protein SX243_26090 [Acidobacteriota bacterium]|nr:hypothetical protein [Acidobacteriota bacterium]